MCEFFPPYQVFVVALSHLDSLLLVQRKAFSRLRCPSEISLNTIEQVANLFIFIPFSEIVMVSVFNYLKTYIDS